MDTTDVMVAVGNLLTISTLTNLVLALINYIFVLINACLIIKSVDAKLIRIEQKSLLALKDMYSRDMHPKLKMSLMQFFSSPNQLPQLFDMIKQPGIFDNLNGPLEGGPAIGPQMGSIRQRKAPKEKVDKRALNDTTSGVNTGDGNTTTGGASNMSSAQ